MIVSPWKWELASSSSKHTIPLEKSAKNNTSAKNDKSFSQAFKEARAAGLKEFEWKGKKFTTKLKTEVKITTAPLQKKSPIEVFPKLLHSSPMFPDSLSHTMPEGKYKQRLGNQVVKLKVKNK